jgi:hypothetical protein
LAVDENHQIIAFKFTITDVGDQSALADLLDQLDAASDYFIAYDVHDGIPVIQTDLGLFCLIVEFCNNAGKMHAEQGVYASGSCSLPHR